MLFTCCLIQHVNIITLRHISYLVYLCPCLGLVHFMLYLYDLLFIFRLIFSTINHITSFIQPSLSFIHFFEYLHLFLDDNVDKERK